MIRFKCPNCDVVLNAPDLASGKEASCLKCRKWLVVPRFRPPFFVVCVLFSILSLVGIPVTGLAWHMAIVFHHHRQREQGFFDPKMFQPGGFERIQAEDRLVGNLVKIGFTFQTSLFSGIISSFTHLGVSLCSFLFGLRSTYLKGNKTGVMAVLIGIVSPFTTGLCGCCLFSL